MFMLITCEVTKKYMRYFGGVHIDNAQAKKVLFASVNKKHLTLLKSNFARPVDDGSSGKRRVESGRDETERHRS